MSDIDLRMALDAACDLIVALIEGEGGNVRGNAPMLDEWRSLASAPPEVDPTPGERILSADALVMVPPRAGALCRAAIKWREWARKLEKTAPEDADEELIAAVDEFLGIPSSETP